MNCLIVYSHPNPKSFCHAILQTVTESLKQKGHEVAVTDLYAIKFDPILNVGDFEKYSAGAVPDDVKEQQQRISSADLLVFIYPVWWTGLPAMIKGYIDRVMTLGFAFMFTEKGELQKLLAGKKAVVFNTHGMPADVYVQGGMYDAMKKTSDTGIFDFCGLEVLEHKFFPAVPLVDDATRKNYLEQARTLIEKVS